MTKKTVKIISLALACILIALCVLFLLGNHFRFVSDKEELYELLGYDLSNFNIEEVFSYYDNSEDYSSTVGVVLDCEHSYFDSFLEISREYPEVTIEDGFGDQFRRYTLKEYDESWEGYESVMALGILNSAYPHEE